VGDQEFVPVADQARNATAPAALPPAGPRDQ
jgi:hypothetical protein